MNAPIEQLPDTSFVKLSKVDVSKHIEKKGRFSYLSWPFAVSQLRQVEPTATWDVKRFDGMPYMKTELGYFVEVEVVVNGIALSQIHPVLDSSNKPIKTPTSFDINTSIQRCLVKAIALHGLGLQLYAGEDLPLVADDPVVDEKLLLEAQTAALNGMDSLAKFHKANQNKQGYSEMWKIHGDSLKSAATEADKELAGAM